MGVMSTQHAWHVPEWTMGDRLRKAREDAGLSQAQLAAAIGISRNTVSNAELGDRTPLTITLRAWADVTGVPLQWLQTGTIGGGPRPRGQRAAGVKRRDTELMQYRYHSPNGVQMPTPLKVPA